MNSSDLFLSHYGQLIDWHYDCLDRIVMNGMFLLGQSPGGFRFWWREYFGHEDRLNNDEMRKMAGDFSRRISYWAKENGVAVIDCAKNERKDELAEPFIEKARMDGAEGVFLILTGLAPAPVWRVQQNAQGTITDICREKPWPFVKHYHFHLMDKNWGHVIVRIGGYPPYGVQVILNGHEWVERRCVEQKCFCTMEDNSFVQGQQRVIRRVCAELMTQGSLRLEEVCRRWVYGSVLPFALPGFKQNKSTFHYDWRLYQIEYSRNYIFHSGRAMSEIYDGLIDRNRSRMDVPVLKTIFGVRGRPHKRLRSANEPRGPRDAASKEVSQPAYDLSVFKLHWDKSTSKMYDKGARLLRVEAVEHNVKKSKTRGRLDRWDEIIEQVKGRTDRFINAMQYIDQGLLDMGRLGSLRKPSKRGQKRLAGIDLHNPRMRDLCEALISLFPRTEAFKLADVVKTVQTRTGKKVYTKRQAAYDLSKFIGKKVVQRIPHSRCYTIDPERIRELAAYLRLEEKVIKPICTKARSPKEPICVQNTEDQYYEKLRIDMIELFEHLQLIAA